METTLLIGKIVSPYFLISGLGFLISGNFYKSLLKNSDKSDPMTINLSGMVHFFLGMIILVNHFLWGNIFQIVITLVGFSFIGKGFAFIVLPKLMLKSTNSSVNVLRLSGIGFILVSFYLGYMSYFS